ncbi:hypothetical protein [Wenyingzhuangia sp. IMCC45467]
MKEDSNELSSSLVETISKSDLTVVGKDLLEVGIDSILKNGLLKDIPVINVATGVWNTGVAIRDYRFITKLLYFLNESSKLSSKQRENIIEKLEDNKFQEEAGEKLISIIDNLETKSKAKIIGKAMCLVGNNIISKDEFWRISFIIEKLPTSDIYALINWRDTDLNKVEHVRKHLYMSVGLGWFVLDLSSTGFVWTERLCEIISDYLIKE